MKALTAAEMREVDRLTTERFGIPGLELMEAAGKSVAEVFLEKFKERNGRLPGLVGVLCGKGNNGGDGFVVARLLKGQVGRVKVFLFAEPGELRGDAAKNYERWKGLGEDVALVRNESEWEKAWTGVAASEVMVDALLGTGIRGGARAGFARASYGDVYGAENRATGFGGRGELRHAGGAGDRNASGVGRTSGEGEIALGGAGGIFGTPVAKGRRSAQGIVRARAAGGWICWENGRGRSVRTGGAARGRGIGDAGAAAACACDGGSGAGRIHDGGAAGDGVGDDCFGGGAARWLRHADAWHDGFGNWAGNWDSSGDTGICAQRGGACGFADSAGCGRVERICRAGGD